MYRITTDEKSSAQIAALPTEAMLPYAGITGLLELVPWRGEPTDAENPDSPIRTLLFGYGGMITYLILDDQLRVDILDVTNPSRGRAGPPAF